MRTVLMALAAVFVLTAASGCLVASTTRHGVYNKSAVVWQDDIYVVDLNRCTARRVHLEPCHEGEIIETITIEEEGEASVPCEGHFLASSR
ncbi:MAG TPA: hypothetical protein VM431_05020 [Phycisphaerae bacterium]|nr:hypothetical protein [Phycisphaerae bacterium]HUU84234.1 hypothetical protein [Phycisphaerae bacterium]